MSLQPNMSSSRLSECEKYIQSREEKVKDNVEVPNIEYFKKTRR